MRCSFMVCGLGWGICFAEGGREISLRLRAALELRRPQYGPES
jgi:hypothetical protein